MTVSPEVQAHADREQRRKLTRAARAWMAAFVLGALLWAGLIFAERRDPKPPTDDPAAFGGVGCTTTARWQKRVMSDSNISRMATLWDEQRRLSEAVRIAERWANS